MSHAIYFCYCVFGFKGEYKKDSVATCWRRGQFTTTPIDFHRAEVKLWHGGGVRETNAANCLHRTHENGDIYTPLLAPCIWISLICTCMLTTEEISVTSSTDPSSQALSGSRWRASLCCSLQPPSSSSKQTRAFDLALVSTTALGLAFPNLTPVWLHQWGKAHHWRHAGQDLSWGFGQWQPSKTTEDPHLKYHPLWI